jgi:hypothetical protein
MLENVFWFSKLWILLATFQNDNTPRQRETKKQKRKNGKMQLPQ